MSAFFFWLQENRERIKKPGMGVSDIAKAAGVEWGKLTDKSVSSSAYLGLELMTWSLANLLAWPLLSEAEGATIIQRRREAGHAAREHLSLTSGDHAHSNER